ncbi:MAG: hypothetical protein DMG61_10200 [Acidobacteria bacterium]|nr:MAG: hypothetical protein DMG61_10200 [Acidobacteriota bacterium]
MSNAALNPIVDYLSSVKSIEPRLSWLNETAFDANREFVSVPQQVATQAATMPDRMAAVQEGKSLSYRELNQRADLLARHLRSLGVGPNVVVALYVNRSLAMLVGALAILRAGGAYLPLDPIHPAERLTFFLKDASIKVIVTGECMLDSLTYRPEHLVVIDPEGRLPAGDEENEFVCPSVKEEDLAYVIYTSGSTGQPKGVEITHRGLANLVSWHHRAFNITADDRASQLAALGFDAAVWEIWPYLTAGASIHLAAGLALNEPGEVRNWLISRGITITFLPTPLAERVIALEWPAKPTLRVMLTGADTLHHYPSRKLRFQLVNNYGPTECSVVATSGIVLPNPENRDNLPSIGRPIDNTQIYILDERMQQVPLGEPGEIYIGGAGLGRGYRNRPDLTAERFVANPFASGQGTRLYKTGDLGCFLPNGEIAFLGRIDEQLKIRGYRIEPAEIVKVLDEHPAVQASAVAGHDLEDGNKRLVAYLVLASDGQHTHTELRNFIASRLPEYMVPAVFVVLNALPLSSSGKVDRAALPTPTTDNTLRDSTFVAPRTDIEKRVADTLASLLDLGQVSVDDNFFLLGGHSLLGTQLIARLRDAFGIEISLRSLFDAPTVAELSRVIESLIMAKLEAMSDEEAQRLMDGPAAA